MVVYFNLKSSPQLLHGPGNGFSQGASHCCPASGMPGPVLSLLVLLRFQLLGPSVTSHLLSSPKETLALIPGPQPCWITSEIPSCAPICFP